MATENDEIPDRERRLYEAIGQYFAEAERGAAPDRRAFLARHPDLAAELDEFFAEQGRFHEAIGPLRELAGAEPVAGRAEPDGSPLDGAGTELGDADAPGRAPSGPGAAAAETQVLTPDPARAPGVTTALPPGREPPATPPPTPPPTPNGSGGPEPPRGARLRYFGDYELRSVLGRGGMGVVYRARQLSLHRLVAVKMLRSGAWADADELRRFHNEAEAVAELDHPGIVPIYEVGQHRGRHYFSMKLVEGASLAEQLGRFAADPKAAAHLVAEVAHAVHHAHQRGILHRDLKPGNIMVDAEGRPHVTDFGLARRIDADLGLTASGAVVGTPGYMAPEQAEGRRRGITTATDVYGLGAVLYACLTGRAPFEGDSAVEVLQRVRERPPTRPGALNGRVGRDLETICLKCLRKDPGRRYESAQALAEDLRRFHEGEPIAARPVGSLERTWRWCRRNPVVAGSLGAAAAALVAVAGLALLYADRQSQSRAQISGLAKDLAGEKDNLERRVAALYYERGQAACEKGEIGPGLLWTVESWRAADRAGDAAWQHAARTNLAAWQGQYPRLLGVFSHARDVVCVAFSPDGKRILTGTLDGMVRAWDPATSQPIGPAPSLPGATYPIAFSPDGRTVLTGCADETARLWDVATGQPLGSPMVQPDTDWAPAFSPDGKSFLIGGADGVVRLRDVATGKAIGSPMLHRDKIFDVTFSPDGKAVLTGSRDKTARLWDPATGRPLGPTLKHQAGVFDVAFSPDGKRILTGTLDGAVRLWDAATGQPIGPLMPLEGPMIHVAFSPDGKTALIASGGVVRLWDPATGQPIGPPLPNPAGVWSMAFSPDGQAVLIGCSDGTAWLWSAAIGPPVGEMRTEQTLENVAAFSPDGKTLLTGSIDRTARLWDVATGKAIGSPMLHRDRVWSVAFSPDGKTLLTGGDDGAVRLWDAASGRPLGLTLTDQAGVHAVAFSPDGKAVLTGGADSMVRLWDAASGKPFGSPMPHHDQVKAVAFSPDGKTLLTGSIDKTARLWDAATCKPLGPPLAHQGVVWAVAFRADGQAVLTGSWDKTARLWDAATARPVGSPLRHPSGFWSVAFSPDGKTLLTGCGSNTARLWDAATAQPLGPPLRHHAVVLAAAFSPDGKTLLTGSGDGTARAWPTVELPDDLGRVATWVEALTGLTLDASGSIQPLDRDAWLARREAVQRQGGPPEVRTLRGPIGPAGAP